MQNIRIQTTQNVFIEYETASIGDRIFAGLIDWLIYVGYWLFVYYIVEETIKNYDLKNSILFIAFIPFSFYDLLCELFLNGQSIGKKIRKIKVVRIDGTQPTIGNYLLRWIIRPIDAFPFFYGIAIVAISANGKGQRLGDIAAGTTVVNLKRRVSLEETNLPSVDENYEPVYFQVTLLTNKDIALVKEAMSIYRQSSTRQNEMVLVRLSDKLKQVLQINDNTSHWIFLNTVLKDYAHFAEK